MNECIEISQRAHTTLELITFGKWKNINIIYISVLFIIHEILFSDYLMFI